MNLLMNYPELASDLAKAFVLALLFFCLYIDGTRKKKIIMKSPLDQIRNGKPVLPTAPETQLTIIIQRDVKKQFKSIKAKIRKLFQANTNSNEKHWR